MTDLRDCSFLLRCRLAASIKSVSTSAGDETIIKDKRPNRIETAPVNTVIRCPHLFIFQEIHLSFNKVAADSSKLVLDVFDGHLRAPDERFSGEANIANVPIHRPGGLV